MIPQPRHSGMVRRTRPGISRFRVRCYASPRNDGESDYNPSTIFATISRWISDEPPKIVYARLLRYSGTTGSSAVARMERSEIRGVPSIELSRIALRFIRATTRHYREGTCDFSAFFLRRRG